MNDKTKLLNKVLSKETLLQNVSAIESFVSYKKTKEIIERTEIALGRKNIISFSSASAKNTIIENQSAKNNTTKI